MLLSATMPFYSGFLLRMRILKPNSMSVWEVNDATSNFPAPAKAQNATALEGEQFGEPSCLQQLTESCFILTARHFTSYTNKPCVFLCECRKISWGKTKTPRSKTWPLESKGTRPYPSSCFKSWGRPFWWIWISLIVWYLNPAQDEELTNPEKRFYFVISSVVNKYGMCMHCIMQLSNPCSNKSHSQV